MRLTPSLCHKLSHLLGPPQPSSCVTYFMDGPIGLLDRISATSGGDLAPSLGGRKNFWRTKMTFFPEKISIFTPTISDDLSFLSHRPGFSDFTFLYCIKCRMRPFLHKKTTISEKNSFIGPFFTLCVYFRAHPTTLLL